MSVIAPEHVESTELFESFEFEIICDIAEKRQVSPEWPACKGDAARWVAWRPNCCPDSPRYRLICDRCKSIYQAWAAKQAFIYCGYCGNETQGFVSFTPLKG